MKPGYISDSIRSTIILNICGHPDGATGGTVVSPGWIALSCGDPRVQMYEPQLPGYYRVKCNLTSVMAASGTHTLNPGTGEEVTFYGTYNLNYLYFGEILTADGWPSDNIEATDTREYTHFAIMSTSAKGTGVIRYSGELNTPLLLNSIGTIPLIRPQKLIVAIN